MNHLIARVKDRKNCFRKIASGDIYYDELAELDSVTYDPATLIEDGQWYKVEQFSKQEYFPEILAERWDSTEYDLISKLDTEKLSYICAYQDERKYYFQRIYKSSVLMKKHFSIGDNIKLEQGKSILVLNESPDALYDKQVDILYFKKLESIAPIFKGIDSLYKEATVQDVALFFEEPFMNINVEFQPANVGKANRKRLALVREKLLELDQKQKKEVFDYTNDYYPELSYDGNQFTINNDEDLKNLLFGIEERFYTTPVTHEQRAANSVITIRR